MRKRCAILIMAAAAVLTAAGGYAAGGEVDILVEKLVQKGVLSRDDAREILVQVRQEAEKSAPSWSAGQKKH